ncbi:MAG: hypothetical protein A3E85_04780 [Gammaproteobacteria bacterium RIFCSPHIGHO2_12_FULL_45_12]|nr:MAG: hypothetical protein A3E85_04780 [Gammaproteobacteria bacterium RIFCSPHIGHO2_12_FULL_45_12]
MQHYILDCFVAQNAPRNDDSAPKIIYATTLIAKALNVSIAKITRGSNELKRLPEATLPILKESLSMI